LFDLAARWPASVSGTTPIGDQQRRLILAQQFTRQRLGREQVSTSPTRRKGDQSSRQTGLQRLRL
jgi:hypothetical protein